MLKSLISIITSRLLWAIIGFSVLSLIIWYIGPYIAIGDYHPLRKPLHRVIFIAAILGVWLLIKLLVMVWRRHRATKAAASEESDLQEIKDEPKLVERFEEATRLLKKSYTHRMKPRFLPNWLWWFNRRYIYQLPWYVLLGAPGAGKTTALANSGVHFPLTDRFGKTARQANGNTRHCD